MNGGLSQAARVLESAHRDAAQRLADPSPAVIDDGADPGAWARALVHSPLIHCACCGGPAHACAVVAGARAEALADSADGSGIDPFAPEHLS
jgi:hypothetical protein